MSNNTRVLLGIMAECKPKLVSTEFGKSGSFAIDYNGDFVIERGFAWKLKEIDDLQFKKYAEAYLAIFNSEYMNQLLSMYADQLAGGDIYRLGLASVKAIPIPVAILCSKSSFPILLRVLDIMLLGIVVLYNGSLYQKAVWKNLNICF